MTYGSMIEALAPPTRRAVFERLRSGPLSVGALADGMPVSRPAVSQHLKALKEAGLVIEERQGVRRIYRLDVRGVAALRDYFNAFWDEALEAYARSVEGRDA